MYGLAPGRQTRETLNLPRVLQDRLSSQLTHLTEPAAVGRQPAS
jgi:hypothetical protein